MKGIKINYKKEELEFIQSGSKKNRKELTDLFNEKFKRNISHNNISALCKRNNWLTGRNGRFEKGRESWNKNTKGLTSANTTSFKKGDKPHNTKPIYSERTTKDGYVMIKVKNNNNARTKTKYVLKHIWAWEQSGRDKPNSSQCLKFIDGDRSNCDIDNLKIISRYENLILGKKKYDHADDSIKPTIMLTAQLQNKINDLRNKT